MATESLPGTGARYSVLIAEVPERIRHSSDGLSGLRVKLAGCGTLDPLIPGPLIVDELAVVG